MSTIRQKRLMQPLTTAAISLALFVTVMVGLRLIPQHYPVADGAMLEIYTLHATHGTLRVGAYSRFHWNHPGPAYFYLLAPGYLLSGHREESLLVTVLLVNLASVAGLLWVARKHGGSALAWALAAWLAVFYLHQNGSSGWDFGDLLSNPWNPHTPMLPFALLIVLSAALASGSLVVLPVALLVASIVVQAHVAFVPVAATAVAVGLGLDGVRRLRLAGGMSRGSLALARRVVAPVTVPIRARVVDAVVSVYVILLAYAIAAGGLDVEVAGLRISAHAPAKLALIAVVLIVIRHFVWRHHPRAARIRDVLARRERSEASRRISPAFARDAGLTALVLAVMWGLPLADEVAHWGSGNLVRLVQSLAGSPAVDLGRGFAAFTTYLPAVLRPDLQVAAGGQVLTASSVNGWDVLLSLGQLVLLCGAVVWAVRRQRAFHAAMGLVGLAVSAAAFWSMVRVRGDLYDHLAFWIGIVGVVNLGVITAVPLEWVTARVGRRRRGDVDRDTAPGQAGRWERMAAGLFVAALGVYGAMHIVEAHQQRRFGPDRATVETLSTMLQTDLEAHALAGRPTLVDLRQDVWPIAAGIVLQLYKTGTPLAVTDPWVFLFGPPLASTGRAEVEVVCADEPLHDQLRHDPGYRLVGQRDGVYVYVRRLSSFWPGPSR